MPNIRANTGFGICINGGQETGVVLAALGTELIPEANIMLVNMLPELYEIAVHNAMLRQVPYEAIQKIVPRTFVRGGGKTKFGVSLGGKMTISVGFQSASDLGGTAIQGYLQSRGIGRGWSNWRFKEYPPGRRLWQEEFGLAGTTYSEASIKASITAAGGIPWKPPIYSLYRGHDIGYHYIYGSQGRDSRGKFQPGLKEGPGRPPKAFLRKSIHDFAMKFSEEFSLFLKKRYDKIGKKALADMIIDQRMTKKKFARISSINMDKDFCLSEYIKFKR